MSAQRTDRVPLQGGIVHLPAEFREVARLANQAGLEGWRFVDAEIGMAGQLGLQNLPWCENGHARGQRGCALCEEIYDPWVARIEITYTTASAEGDGMAGGRGGQSATPIGKEVKSSSQEEGRE